ncbi:MAG: ATP-binding cassette domain-containing protein, partial [Roseibacillus sp.]|nr:ATP-binding cassette domain-containing protein [Roseibacillus sp.]
GAWLRGSSFRVSDSDQLGTGLETGRKLVIKGAREHNLRNVEVEIPLGQLVAVTGPSGSGKSTLVDKILKRALARVLHGAKEVPGE